MTVPFSSPAIPAQPEAEFYGIQELSLFKTYTRETYRAAFGIEPPPYDPSRLIKSWFDSTADVSHPENVAIYRVAGHDQNNRWTTRQLVIPAREAATVNLPGEQRYPAYVVPPTTARRAETSIDPIYLSLESEARALMIQFGGSNLGDEGEDTVFPVTYPPSERRRLWYFVYNNRPVNTGALLYNRNKRGVGAPGRWDVSSGEPVWIPDAPGPTGLDDSRPPREMPIRDLLPNEILQATMMGVMVVRTDKQKQSELESGKFTVEDRAVLRSIQQAMMELARK